MKTGFVTTLKNLQTYYPNTTTTSSQLKPSLMTWNYTAILHYLSVPITQNNLQHGAEPYQR